jgi:glycosyltransferase involved in cell wall biosynthesis
LGQALDKLIGDPELRNRLAQAGFNRVRQEFSMDRGIDILVGKLNESLGDD